METNYFTPAEEAVLYRAFVYVIAHASDQEFKEVLGGELTFVGPKFGISVGQKRRQTESLREPPSDYTVHMSARETAALGMIILAGAPMFPELMEELQGVRESIEVQAKKRVHDQKERKAAEGREEFASAAQARSFSSELLSDLPDPPAPTPSVRGEGPGIRGTKTGVL